MKDYLDDYPPCAETYAMLRVSSLSHNPEFITRVLGIEPVKVLSKGDSIFIGSQETIAEDNFWLYSTKNDVSSKDSRRHVEWILGSIKHKKEELDSLRDGGAKIVISNLWVSDGGAGGPILSPKQMSELSRLGLDIYWDVRS